MIAFRVILCYYTDMIYFDDNLRYHHLRKNEENEHVYQRCYKDFYELIYFASADVELSMGTTTYFPAKHSIALIAPGTSRSLVSAKDKTLKLFHVSFDKSLAPDWFNLEEKANRVFSFQYNSTINLMFLTLQSLERRNYDSTRFLRYLKEFLPLILLELDNDAEDKKIKKTPSNKVISQCVDFINSNVTSIITLETLAEKFFISKSYLSHAFKNCFGMGVKQYVNKQKMLYAQKLIKSGTTPVKASRICSFDNYSTFFRQYKTFFGVTPEQDK